MLTLTDPRYDAGNSCRPGNGSPSGQPAGYTGLANKPSLTSAEWRLIYSDHLWSFCPRRGINLSNEKGCGPSELVTR